MTVYNLGSVNIDYFYEIPHLPGAGETVSARAHRIGLGGKGANQSVAAALSGAATRHIGMVGPDGDWAVTQLAASGVDTGHVATCEEVTAHAVIMVDPVGENAIVINPGANSCQSEGRIAAALADAGPGDTLLLQNETSCQVPAARAARERGMRVIYSAAPFELAAVRDVLPHVSVLVLNRVEAGQLARGLGRPDVPELIVTMGSEGARWERRGGPTLVQPAFPVAAIDTTGAGDCFTGALAAALDGGAAPEAALRFAAAAAAIQVTRPGTAQAMPTRDEVEAFLAEQGQGGP